MKYGTTKTGKIHIFTEEKECVCDLNIKMNKEVSKEFAFIHFDNICFNCLNRIGINNKVQFINLKEYLKME